MKDCGSLKVERDQLLQKFKYSESEKVDIKNDNIKMCQIIRDYETKVYELQSCGKESQITLEAKMKQINNENKSLKAENMKLAKRMEEWNYDCEKLTQEYKSLLKEVSTSKLKDQKQNLKVRKEKSLRQEYEAELKRISAILDQSEDNKKGIIEKYAQEIENLKETFERTIAIQKENFKIFKEKVDEEFDFVEKKLYKKNGKSKNFSKGKDKDRVSDLLREITVKEVNLKTLKSDWKSLKTTVSKLKNKNKELKNKVWNLNKIIDSYPRAKRLLEKQNGEIDYSFSRIKTEMSRKSYEGIPDGGCNITVREHNELLEQNINMKIENNKLKNSVVQLEEINVKLESELDYFDNENVRLTKRCENLITSEADFESRNKVNNEIKLKEKIRWLSAELNEAHDNFIPIAELEQVQMNFERCQNRLNQVERELIEKNNKIDDLQKQITEMQSISHFSIEENQSPNEQRSSVTKQLKDELKNWKIENIKLSSEIENLQNKITKKDTKIINIQTETEKLKNTVELVEEKGNRLQQINKNMGQLKAEIQTKDEIISKLKNNLDQVMKKFKKSPRGNSKEYSYEEMVIAKQNERVSLENLLFYVHEFFNQANDVEINEFLNSIKRLWEQIEEESLSESIKQEFEAHFNSQNGKFKNVIIWCRF